MYLALDVGGTSINIGVYETLSPESLLHQGKILVENNFEKDINQVAIFLESVKALKFDAVGIGIPGVVNEEKTVPRWISNLKSWEGKVLKDEIKKFIEFNDIYVAHDVKTAAASEAIFGELNTDFTFIIWGTGIGGCSVKFIEGKPYFQQVELGFHTISETIQLEGKTFPGYLEYFCGGGRLKQRFGKEAKDLSDSDWNDVFEKMSQGLHNLLVLNHSSLLVFSGGVIVNQQQRLSLLENLTAEKVRFTELAFTKFKMSKFGEDAGLIGALALIKLNQDVSSGN